MQLTVASPTEVHGWGSPKSFEERIRSLLMTVLEGPGKPNHTILPHPSEMEAVSCFDPGPNCVVEEFRPCLKDLSGFVCWPSRWRKFWGLTQSD